MRTRTRHAPAMLQIGEVAERVGLSLRTVRYYEEMGLLTPEERTGGGFRLYTEGHVERLALIKRMKPLGFTVQQMRDVLAAHDALAAADTPAAARAEAAASIKAFAKIAAARVDELREQLDSAEALTRQLRRETRRATAARRS